VEKNWSGENEEGDVVSIEEQTKEVLRVQMLELATSGDADRKIKSAARSVPLHLPNMLCVSERRMLTCGME
jgi:hypothetical protein